MRDAEEDEVLGQDGPTEEAAHTRAGGEPGGRKRGTSARRASEVEGDAPGPLVEALAARRLGLVLDFDGTLTDIVARPDDAWLRPDVLEALRALAATDGTQIAVLSGRALGDLAARVPVPGVWLVGGHGADLRRPDGTREALVDVPGARRAIETFITRTRQRVGPDVLIEDKGLCAAVHVRGLPPAEAARVASIADGIAGDLARTAPVQRTTGKAVIELVARGIDKGVAARDLLVRWRPDVSAAIGDDSTDEHMFRALSDRAAITIKVGPEPTSAHHRLASVDDVARLLTDLARARACARPAAPPGLLGGR